MTVETSLKRSISTASIASPVIATGRFPVASPRGQRGAQRHAERGGYREESGTEAFERVGWTDPFSRGPEGEQFKLDETMASAALLLGRVTYDGFAPRLASRSSSTRGLRDEAVINDDP